MKKQYIGIGVVLVFLVIGIFLLGIIQTEDKEPTPINYRGLVLLGLAPNSDPRIATDTDIDTGLRTEHEGQLYGLFESRTWKSLDYGKTFVSPVSR